MMKLLTAVLRMFGFGRKVEDDKTDEAIARIRSAGATADALNEKLKPYLASRDPFSMFVGDMYNLGQSSRVYRGHHRGGDGNKH